MSRVVRILLGLGLIGYGIYSGNAWFYLGFIPLLVGVMNWCPMGAIGGECSNGNCAPVAKEESSDNKETKSSCCGTPEEQIAKFKASTDK